MEAIHPGGLPPAAPAARRFTRRTTGLVLLAGLLLVVGGCSRAEEPAAPAITEPPLPTPYDLAPEAVIDPAFPSLTYSIQAFLWWNGTTRPYDLDAMRLMNFTHVKQMFSWADVEPVAGEWHWQQADAVVSEAQCRGRQIVARVDRPPEWATVAPGDDPTAPPVDLEAWSEFCGTLAARYRGQIAAYQVWNEPNLSREWGDRAPNAEGYVSLLRTCSQAIHAADPAAIVISAGLAPTGTTPPEAVPDMDYLRQMYAAGASEWFDVLGLNAPGYGNPPEMSPEAAAAEDGYRWMSFRHVEDMRAIMVEQGDAAKQIAILELGWTTDAVHPDYAWHAVTDEQQAQYLVGAYRWAAAHWRPWVGLMTTIYLSDFDWTPDDEEYWWAIDLPSFPPKTYRPAYGALANMEKVSGDTVIPERDPGAPEATTLQPLTCPN